MVRKWKILSGVNNHEYIHGDFDEDDVPNIDDRAPFNPDIRERVNPEVSLSDVFNLIESGRKHAEKIARPLAKKHGAEYRIKDSYSIIGKLVRKNPQLSNDLIGLRKTTTTRMQAQEEWERFNKKTGKVDADNKYVTNKNTENPYRAFHSNFETGGFGAEFQFVTKKFKDFNFEMHEEYKKKGMSGLSAFLKKGKKLEEAGY